MLSGIALGRALSADGSSIEPRLWSAGYSRTEACDAVRGALRPKWREWPVRGISRVLSVRVAFGMLMAALFALVPSP
jgi:hypothetical protein